MNDYSVNELFDPLSSFYNGALTFNSTPPSAQNIFTDGVSPAALVSGELQGNTTVRDGYLQSGNYVASTTGWRLTPTSGEINFALTIASGTIGGWTIGASALTAGSGAATVGLDSTVTGGDDVRIYAGSATPASAPFRVTEAGALTATSATITGALTTGASSSIGTGYLSGTIAQANLNVADRGWTQTSAFSVTDADTVAWGAGTFTSADGTAYSIGAGNTGNMAAKTYVYLDIVVSTTAYQTTTTATTAVGVGKVLIATAQNNTTEAIFTVMSGQGGTNIDAASIVAGSITANEIAATTITAGKMSVSQLSAIAADLGAITAGTVTVDTAGYIRGGQTAYNTGTGFFLGYSGAAYKFSVGNPSGNYITWDGSTLTVVGNQVQVTTYTSGSGNWTKPTGAKMVFVQAWGAGGAGGGCNGIGQTAGGGGGGAYNEYLFNASDLGSTEAYVVGAGATGGTGNGAAGGNTSFSTLIAYAGGGGADGIGGDGASGGGGGITVAGSSTTGTTGGNGGGPIGGTGGGSGADGTTAIFGGAGGGGLNGNGGQSIMGGGGGGQIAGNSYRGGAGGGEGSGGTGGTSTFGGNGGNGGSNGNGSAGSAPGGGGGGGGTAGASSANGGDGAAGKLIVTAYL